jgi:hypothetical protein
MNLLAAFTMRFIVRHDFNRGRPFLIILEQKKKPCGLNRALVFSILAKIKTEFKDGVTIKYFGLKIKASKRDIG